MITSVGIRVASNIRKNRTTSIEAKARIRKACREIRSVMYIRWRLIGSWARWFWLARIIIGNNQHESTKRGDESGSVAMYMFNDFHPVSEIWANQVRLNMEIRRLCIRVDGQSHLA